MTIRVNDAWLLPGRMKLLSEKSIPAESAWKEAIEVSPVVIWGCAKAVSTGLL